MANNVEIEDNSAEYIEAMVNRTVAALEACGRLAESYAQTNITKRPISAQSWYTRTGTLRNSIHSRVVDEDDSKVAIVGTDVEYAPYVEFGTGPKANGTTADGKAIKGRSKVPWFFTDPEGNGHLSYGIEASHFLKNAVTEHKDEYKSLLEQYLKG